MIKTIHRLSYCKFLHNHSHESQELTLFPKNSIAKTHATVAYANSDQPLVLVVVTFSCRVFPSQTVYCALRGFMFPLLLFLFIYFFCYVLLCFFVLQRRVSRLLTGSQLYSASTSLPNREPLKQVRPHKQINPPPIFHPISISFWGI